LTSPAIQFDQLDSVPLAVIRRQASASELSRVVPQCCGLVWNAVRAQQARAGRHVAIYWDDKIRLEVGVELHGLVRSATPAGPVAWTTHLGPYSGLGAAWLYSHRRFPIPIGQTQWIAKQVSSPTTAITKDPPRPDEILDGKSLLKTLFTKAQTARPDERCAVRHGMF
jgi:hypothetical protein